MENNASTLCYPLGRLQLVSVLEACWPWSVVPKLLVGNASFDVVRCLAPKRYALHRSLPTV
eukprot:132166-Chlamydomonas_euryale.AAC.1